MTMTLETALDAPATTDAAETAPIWTAPQATEIACGMEINMYAPADDDGARGGDVL